MSVALLAGCPSYADFATDDESVWTGVVIGSETPESCDPEATSSDDAPACSFILRGLTPTAVLDLELFGMDESGAAGTVTIRDEICGAPALPETPLRVIEPLEHDALSLLDLPGQGRVRNTMYSLRPASGPFAGRDVLAVVSLLREQRVEIRLMAGEGRRCAPSDCDSFADNQCDLFAVFVLRRETRP